MPNDKPEKKKFSKKSLPKAEDKINKIDEVSHDKEEEEFESEAIEPFTIENDGDFNQFGNKKKCTSFFEGYVTMKINEANYSPDILNSVIKELQEPNRDFLKNISSGVIKLGLVSKDVLNILSSKGNSKLRVNTEELICLDNINDEEKEIDSLNKKIIKCKSNIELIEKQLSMMDDNKNNIVKKKALEMKINEYKSEKERTLERIDFLRRNANKLKEDISRKRKRNYSTLKDQKKKFIDNFKQDTEKVQDKVKEWTESRHERKKRVQEIMEQDKQSKEAMLEELTKKENEEKQKRIEQHEQRFNKYKEKIEAVHEEISNLKVPPTVIKEYTYQLNEKEQRMKEFNEKEEVEKSVEKLKKIKKSRVPNDEEIAAFMEKVEEKKIEIQEKIEKKKEIERKTLFGDKENSPDRSEDEEAIDAYQSFFYSKLIEEQKLKEDILKEKEEERRKRSEKKNKFVKSIILPDINPRKKKEMNEMKTKSVGMHLHNSYNNGKDFIPKRKKIKNINKKILKMRKALSTIIKKRKEEENLKNKNIKTTVTHLNNLTISRIEKDPLVESSRFGLSKISKLQLFNNQQRSTSPLKDNYLNLSHHELNLSPKKSYELKLKNSQNKPLRTPIEIRRPLDKYPDYLAILRKEKSEFAGRKNSTYLVESLEGENKSKTNLLTQERSKHDKNKTSESNIIENYKSINDNISSLEYNIKNRSLLSKVSGGPVGNIKASEELSNYLSGVVKKKLELLTILNKGKTRHGIK